MLINFFSGFLVYSITWHILFLFCSNNVQKTGLISKNVSPLNVFYGTKWVSVWLGSSSMVDDTYFFPFSLAPCLRPFARRRSFVSLCALEISSELPEDECTNRIRGALYFPPAPPVLHSRGPAQIGHPLEAYALQSWCTLDC